MSGISQKDYLKRYLSGPDNEKKAKKKKKKDKKMTSAKGWVFGVVLNP